MKKIVVIGAGFALALSAVMSHASGIGNTYNEGGKGGAGGNASANAAAVGVGVGIGQGGAGGAGGQGGRGGEGGAGGSVWGSGNSSNHNTNAQGQMQGQQQGQAQSSRNSNRNDNRSSATGGNSNATGGNGYANNANSNENHGNNSNQSVTVQGDSYDAPRIPVATAYAPNIAPTATCMGSSGAGLQLPGIGITGGSSWTDQNCAKLERIRTVATVLNDPAVASEMMCDIPDYAAARARAGKPCGQQQQVAAASIPTQPQTVAVSEQHQPKYVASAPIVVSPVAPRIERFRITTDGLQPL